MVKEKVEKKKAKKGDKKESGKKLKLKPIEKQVIWLFVILAVVLGGIILGVVVKEKIASKADSFEWSDFTVYKTRLEGTTVDFYFIPIQVAGGQKGNMMFRSDPRAVENISLDIDEELFKRISMIWVTTDPEYDSDAVIAAGEIGRLTAGVSIPTDYALISEVGEFPKITCEDATKTIRVIDIRLGNETRVYAEDNCIIVEADSNNGMIEAADKLAYHWLEMLFIKKVNFD